MKKSIKTVFAWLFVLAVSLTGCGGGSDSVAPSGGKQITSKGVIEKFGSITVNGVEYKTMGAKLFLPDDTLSVRTIGSETQITDDKLLKLGMVVTVKGVLDDNGVTGTATEIEFRDNLKAKIDDKGVDFITVMGQKVILDDKIKSQLSDLNIGDDVAISGMPDDKGGLRATFIEKKTGLGEFEAKGIVSNLAGNTFTLLLSANATAGITVTLGSGVTLPAGVANGSFVEVRANTSGVVLTATKVEFEDELEAEENEELEFEGFVVSGTADNFFIEDQNVRTTATTIFVAGVKGDFALGMKVEVEGRLVDGILVATKVKFKDNVRIDAVVSAVNAANTAATGDITLLGKKVVVTSATQLKGLNGATLLLTGITVGQEVEVRGFVAANGTDIIATRVEVKDQTPDTATFRPFLRGPVTAIDSAGNTIKIAGITLNVGTSFKNKQDVSIDRAAFFSALVLNSTVVKVTWNAPFSATSVAVREAELET